MTNINTFQGQLGIGTNDPVYKLDVQDTSQAADYIAERLITSAASSGISSTGLRLEKGAGYGGVVKGFISQGVGSGLSLHTLNGGTDAQAMTIMNSGNVGIGTNNPKTRLNITSVSSKDDNMTSLRSNAAIRVDTAGDYNDFLSIGIFDTDTPDDNNPTGYIQHSWDSNSDAGRPFVINPVGGNVGVGTTNPASDLHVQGASGELFRYTDGSRTVYGGCTSDSLGAWFGTSTNHMLRFVSNGTTRMTVAADGKVGIGTNAPTAPLMVYADSDNYFGWNPGAANDTSIVDHTALGATSFRKQHFMKMGGRQWYWGYVNDSNGSFGLAFDGGGGNDPDIVAVFNTAGNLYINDLFAEEIKLGGQSTYGLGAVTGTYGSVQTVGTGKGSYEGYSINGHWVFMSNGAGECGIYNDSNNEWQLQCHQNAATNLYYNGVDRFQTTNDGAHVTGAMYADHYYVDDYIYHNGDTNTRIGFGGNDTIHMRTGGTDRLIIDSSGRVRMPYIPCFNAHRNGGNFVNSELTAIPFNGTDINNGGHYSTSNYRFTAPVNGSYAFHARGLHRKQNGNGTVEPTFYQNNGNTSNRGQGFSHMIDSAEQVTNVHIVRAMNAGQYMTHGVYLINSVTDYYYGERLGGFSGYLLG